MERQPPQRFELLMDEARPGVYGRTKTSATAAQRQGSAKPTRNIPAIKVKRWHWPVASAPLRLTEGGATLAAAPRPR
jgi:hypothetical protein